MGGSRGYPPHRQLSLEEKIEIIKEFERTKSRTHLSRLFFCHVGQINRTLQHRIELVAEFRRIQAAGKIRKKRSACRVLQAVGTILHEFVQRCRFYPIQLSDEFLLDKAREIAKILNLVSFRGHNYWLKTFKHRFKLLDVNWDTWHIPYTGHADRSTLHLETIVEELRESKGAVIIPFPTKLNEMEYEVAVRELIENSSSYPGYTPPDGSVINYSDEFNNNTNADLQGLQNSDEDIDMSGYDDNSSDFDPTDLLTIENEPTENADDPMNIDSYQTALSYFRPLEQFTLGKKEEHIIHMIGQLSKVLLKASEREEEEEEASGQTSCPSVVNEVQIEGYRDAAEYLKPLEEFALNREHIRAVGLINQLEILLNDAFSRIG